MTMRFLQSSCCISFKAFIQIFSGQDTSSFPSTYKSNLSLVTYLEQFFQQVIRKKHLTWSTKMNISTSNVDWHFIICLKIFVDFNNFFPKEYMSAIK
jgi:hypothetical protein